MDIEKVCLNCSEVFKVPYKQRDKKYCKRSCYFEHAKKVGKIGRKKDGGNFEVRECKVCSTSFEVRKKTNKEMCSDECRKVWAKIPENKSDRIKKSKDKLVENYGVDSVFKIKSKQKDIKESFKRKYGVNNPMKVKRFKDKLKDNVRAKQLDKLIPKLNEYDLELLSEYTSNKDYKNSTSISYDFKCLKCNNKFNSTVLGSGKIPICRKCYPIQKNSSLELIITDFLNDNNVKHKTSDRKLLDGMELDIIIPEHNIAIEVNGNYWHTETFGGKDKFYHINKTKKCHELGYHLIHIFEDEILFKKDIVMSRLKNMLGLTDNKIYARKCEVREVSFNDKKLFLDNNHIQGNSIDKVRLGLYYNDELVSLMTFSKTRISLGHKSNNGVWELNRFSSIINTNVVGGFTKLLTNFINNNNNNVVKIITYADVRWSGLGLNVYSNGFKYISTTPPNYWYVKVGQYLHRYHRFSFRKDVLVKEGYDPKKTEWEIMNEKGYDRLWDCGSMKFEFNVVPTGASFDDI